MRPFSKLYLLFLFVFGTPDLFTCNAQQYEVDSLTRILAQWHKQDTQMVRLMNQLSFQYHFIQPDSTLAIATRAYKLAKTLDDRFGQAEALKQSAIGYYVRSVYPLAIKRCWQAMSIYRELNDYKGQAAVLNNLANVYSNMGEVDKSLRYNLLSLRVREFAGDEKGMGGSYNNIGNTYVDMGNYSEGLYYLFEGLKIREKTGPPVHVANSFANIAGVYMLLGMYDDARQYALKALHAFRKLGAVDGILQCTIIMGDIHFLQNRIRAAKPYFLNAEQLARQMQDEKTLGVSLSNLGKLYLKEQNLLKSRVCYEESLQISDRIGDIEGASRNLIGLGELDLTENRIPQSIDRLHQGFQLAMRTRSKEALAEGSKLLSDAYEKLNKTKESLVYLNQSMVYKDSLIQEQVLKKSYAVQSDYLVEKQNNRIRLLEMEQAMAEEHTQQQYLTIVFMTIVLVILLLLLYIVYKNRIHERITSEKIKNQHKEIEAQAKSLAEINSVKDTLFTVLSHDLRSPVASLIGMLNLLDEGYLTPAEFLKFKSTFYNQLHALNLLLDNLLLWSQSQMKTGFQVKKESISLPLLFNEVKALYNEMATGKQIHLIVEASEEATLYADKNQMQVVLRNLVSNAIKFSHPNQEVRVTAKETPDGMCMVVSDQGAGMTPEQVHQLFQMHNTQVQYGTAGEKGMGIGLQLCHEFVIKNGGKIEVQSQPGKGSEFRVYFPKHESPRTNS